MKRRHFLCSLLCVQLISFVISCSMLIQRIKSFSTLFLLCCHKDIRYDFRQPHREEEFPVKSIKKQHEVLTIVQRWTKESILRTHEKESSIECNLSFLFASSFLALASLCCRWLTALLNVCLHFSVRYACVWALQRRKMEKNKNPLFKQ